MRTGGPDASQLPSRWDRWLAAGAVTVALGAPLLVGGVHPWTQVVLTTAMLALAATYVGLRGRHGVLLAPFAAWWALATAWTLAQLVPLPAGLVHLLSPQAWEIRSALAGGWMPLTLDVPATVLAALRAFACLGLLVVVAGVSRSRRMSRRLLLALALFGGGFALLAFGQRLVGAQSILGVYRPRSTPGFGFFGTFVDVNHAASLLALTALCAIGFGIDLDGPRRAVVLACAGLATTALLFSTSRGGLVGFAVGGLALAAVLLARSLGKARGLISAGVLLLLAASVTLWAGEGLRARFVPASTSQLWRNQKTRGWRDGLRMSADYAWTGVGRGAFEAPLRAYRQESEAVRLVYPENVVVQYAAEWGWPVTLALALLGLWTLKRVRAHLAEMPPGIVGAGAGVLAVAVHELFDFGTELMGVALPTVLALGLVAGRVIAKDEHKRRVPPVRSLPILAAWATMALVGLWSARRTLDDDDVRLHALVQAKQPAEAELTAAIARHPADDYLELLAAEDGLRRRDTHAMRHLNRALQLDPSNWQAHQLAARLLASAGRPRQAALEYRLALRYGMLTDFRELSRVLGHNVVDAVAQDRTALVALAAQLWNIGRADDAQAACARAADVDEREPAWAACAKLALDNHAVPLAATAGKQLAESASQPLSFALAGQALAMAGQMQQALAVVDRGLHAHGSDPGLVMAAARLRLDGGDLPGARALLVGRADGAWSLAERREAEELLATVADRAGDTQAAVLARARARMLGRRLKETSFNPVGEEHP